MLANMKEEIQEILDLIKPIWVLPGKFEDDDFVKLSELGFTNILDSYYDGKILHCDYKGIQCYFTKFCAEYSFSFKDYVTVCIYDDYQYVGISTVYNDSEQEEQFVNNSDYDIEPFVVTTCFGLNNKITIYNLIK